MPRRVYQLPQGLGAGKREAGTSYCGCSRRILGSSRSEKGKLNDQEIGPILEEVETRQSPEWKYIADPSST
jgi:hypothetical protein